MDQDTPPTDQPIKPKQKPRLVQVTFGLDGPEAEGKLMVQPEPFIGFPQGWRLKHTLAFRLICGIIDAAKQKGNRNIPLLEKELESVLPKQDVRDLLNFGILDKRLVKITLEGEKPSGHRGLVWLTGKALGIRQHLAELDHKGQTVRDSAWSTE